jgi:hypothetical protein
MRAATTVGGRQDDRGIPVSRLWDVVHVAVVVVMGAAYRDRLEAASGTAEVGRDEVRRVHGAAQ